MKVLRIISLSLFSVLLLSSCYYDVEEDLYPPSNCEDGPFSYSMDVVPILQSKCYVCHSSAANLGNITLEGHSALLNYVNDGSLLGAIKHEAGFSPMPQSGGMLLECEINTIETWVADGALNN